MDGEDEEVLLDLRALKDAAGALGLDSVLDFFFRRTRSLPRHELYSSTSSPPALVAYRLAQVYHAVWAGGPMKGKTLFGLPSDVEWLEIFLRDSLITARGYSLGNQEPQKELRWSAEFIEEMIAAGDHSPDQLIRALLFFDPSGTYFDNSQKGLLRIEGIQRSFGRHPQAGPRTTRSKKTGPPPRTHSDPPGDATPSGKIPGHLR